MKHLLSLTCSLILGPGLSAQETIPREDLIAALMEARDEKSFDEAYLAATNADLPEQTLIEARFLYLVDRGSQSELAAFAPILQKQLPDFAIDDSMIFAVREDFESIIQYTLALAALGKKDDALFKKHITEAFWLSPAQAGQFGPLVSEVRLKRAMEKVTLDLDERFEDQRTKDTRTSIGKIMGESKAALLHFWTPWSNQSVESMDDYHVTAGTLADHGIPAISLLLSGTADSQKEADLFLKESGDKATGSWLVDHDKGSLATRLRVGSFPVVVLISKEGKILFNGHPGDPVLWTELGKIHPGIGQPKAPPALPEPQGPDELRSGDGVGK